MQCISIFLNKRLHDLQLIHSQAEPTDFQLKTLARTTNNKYSFKTPIGAATLTKQQMPWNSPDVEFNANLPNVLVPASVANNQQGQ
jgi:hypothetical protein